MAMFSKISLITLAAAVMISGAANAGDMRDKGDRGTSTWNDKNCMFKSAVIQRGGEKTRTSVQDDASPKDQWCSPTARNDAAYYPNNYPNRGARNNELAPAAGY